MTETDQDSPGPAVELLTFRLGGDDYAVDIMLVREIRGWSRTTALPHAPAYVSGVINLRGTVLPVFDLALRLGLDGSEPGERNVIIVAFVGGKTIGLRVDAVSDIVTIPASALQPPPDIDAGTDGPYLKSLAIIEDRMVRLLDLGQILPPSAATAA